MRIAPKLLLLNLQSRRVHAPTHVRHPVASQPHTPLGTDGVDAPSRRH